MTDIVEGLKGWLPRRLWMLAHECDDRAMYAGLGKFARTHSAAADALRQAAQRIKELERERREAAIEIERLREENERLRALRHAFRNADAEDWSRLFRLLGDSAYGRFWTAVLKEAREALADD